MKITNGTSVLILILGALGIVSALLTAALPSGGYLSILYVGAVYGVVLAIYFICYRGFA